MAPIYVLGVDISTQAVGVLLLAIEEHADGIPCSFHRVASVDEPYRSPDDRRDPRVWVQLFLSALAKLRAVEPELLNRVTSIGLCTAFPGLFPLDKEGNFLTDLVNLYDAPAWPKASLPPAEILREIERDTRSRMWPGNMAMGIATAILHKDADPTTWQAALPPNSAFIFALLTVGRTLLSAPPFATDFSLASISGLYMYNAVTHDFSPERAGEIVSLLCGRGTHGFTSNLLPTSVPSARNVLTESACAAIAASLGLPYLTAISIGAGDTPAAGLAFLNADGQCPEILVVRGSSDSPIVIHRGQPHDYRTTGEEVRLVHYPCPITGHLDDTATWCACAPILRSSLYWDWACRLANWSHAQAEEAARAALLRQLAADTPPALFLPRYGGMRAPLWDAHSEGALHNAPPHLSAGDLALAVLEGVSVELAACLALLEKDYPVETPRSLILTGGPASNALWNYLTEQITGRAVTPSAMTDASVVGAAMLGYAALYDATGAPSEVTVNHLRGLCGVVSAEARRPGIAPLTDIPASYARRAHSLLEAYLVQAVPDDIRALLEAQGWPDLASQPSST